MPRRDIDSSAKYWISFLCASGHILPVACSVFIPVICLNCLSLCFAEEISLENGDHVIDVKAKSTDYFYDTLAVFICCCFRNVFAPCSAHVVQFTCRELKTWFGFFFNNSQTTIEHSCMLCLHPSEFVISTIVDLVF